MAACCTGLQLPPNLSCAASRSSQASLLSRHAPPLSASLHRRSPLSAACTKLQTLACVGRFRNGEVRRWRIDCSAADVGAGVSSAGGASESPYQILGVSPLEKFEAIQNVYNRKRKDAEKRGDDATVERLDKAYDRIMMMQLSNRKQGLAFGQFQVSKEIKYADKRSWIPWGPKVAHSERREVLINLAISAFFSVWIVSAGQAEWKPLQFLIFGYMFRIFNKLKEYEPAQSSFSSEEEEEGGGGAAASRRLKNGKRLLRTLGLVFSCIAFASLAFTGALNVYELLGQYIPRTLMGAQELFVTVVSAVSLFLMGSFFR